MYVTAWSGSHNTAMCAFFRNLRLIDVSETFPDMLTMQRPVAKVNKPSFKNRLKFCSDTKIYDDCVLKNSVLYDSALLRYKLI